MKGMKKIRGLSSSRLWAWFMVMMMVIMPLALPKPAYAGNAVEPAISAGAKNTVLLRSDGTVFAWGGNVYGQLGDGTKTNRATPVQVTDPNDSTGKLTGVQAIAAGGEHTVVLKSDGTVWAWGYNCDGQLGNGTAIDSVTPVQVLDSGDSTGKLTGVTAIAAGYRHTVALKNDGTVWAWGSDDRGRLGNGTGGSTNTPVQVVDPGDDTGKLTGVTAIAVGKGYEYGFTVALKCDGTVWTWGSNLISQLGDGTTTSGSTIPVQVTDPNDSTGKLTDVSAIATGGYHTIALKNDGTAWAWGADVSGELGLGRDLATGGSSFEFNKSYACLIPNLNGVMSIAAGDYHTAALKGDGTVSTWGKNDHGQLGDNSLIDRSTPLDVSELNGVTAISAGSSHTTVLMENGTIWAWGRNECGQLGNGTTAGSSIPIRVNAIAIVTPDQPLSQANLDGRVLTVSVYNDSLNASASVSDFSLSNAPSGTTISSVSVTDNTHCMVTLAYDGTDFDNEIANFNIALAAEALASGSGATSNNLTITPVVESSEITVSPELTETNLNGSVLTLAVTNDSFAVTTLTESSFTLNNAPEGTAISDVSYTDETHCTITLAFNGTNFDADIDNFSITIVGAVLNNHGPITTSNLTITAAQELVAVTADQVLTENSLNGQLLSVILKGDTFSDSSLDRANFILNNAPTGLSIGSLFYIDTAHCVLTLSYDGPGFENDIHGFSLTIKGSELSGGEDSISNTLLINSQTSTEPGNGRYTVSPVNDSSYTPGTTGDGIKTMTVNNGVTGFNYFAVNIVSVEAHDGDEVVVFVHLRYGEQLSITAVGADFDSVGRAKAGFNVQAGDVIKAYIVDDLTNDQDFNPTLLQ